ncbi:hypothetical protein BT96DRAFT_999497 [Gymnopus androsaceus JB14]|uniref:Uncharacterized protein n=1 Tax=Gymnopus androsaceus JB14 TaxID=1447944 RepID=A0A6A4H859_9AGAR|nr:hypothetical protein BT96DRAFT_999497 [Gymnopus androsaceus JB14]
MTTPPLPRVESEIQPSATPALSQSESGSEIQPPPTSTNANGAPLAQIRAEREPCPDWKINKNEVPNADNHEKEEARNLALKKKKAESKQESRKRKRNAEASNLEHIPAAPGQKHTFYYAPVKCAFLKNLWDVNQPVCSGTYQSIAKQFIKRFGRNLPLKQDPNPAINYEPYLVNDFPEDEQAGEQARRNAFDGKLSSFLGSWCCNHFTAKVENKPLMKAVLSNIAKPSPSSGRMKDPALEYGKQNWEELREGFYTKNPTAMQDDPHFLPDVNLYKQRRFDELPESKRMEWVNKMKEELAERTAPLNTNADDPHIAANELWGKKMEVLPGIAAGIANTFGMACIIFLSGLVGSDNGNIDVTSRQYIPPSQLYADMDPVGFEGIQKRLINFAEQHFPPEFCEATSPSTSTALVAASTSTPRASTNSLGPATTSNPAALTSTPVASTSTPVALTSTPAASTSTLTSNPGALKSPPEAASTSTPTALMATPVTLTDTAHLTNTAEVPPTSSTGTAPASPSTVPAASTSTPAASTSTSMSNPGALTSPPEAASTSTPAALTATPVTLTDTAHLMNTAEVPPTSSTGTAPASPSTALEASSTKTPITPTATPAGVATSTAASDASTPVVEPMKTTSSGTIINQACWTRLMVDPVLIITIAMRMGILEGGETIKYFGGQDTNTTQNAQFYQGYAPLSYGTASHSQFPSVGMDQFNAVPFPQDFGAFPAGINSMDVFPTISPFAPVRLPQFPAHMGQAPASPFTHVGATPGFAQHHISQSSPGMEQLPASQFGTAESQLPPPAYESIDPASQVASVSASAMEHTTDASETADTASQETTTPAADVGNREGKQKRVQTEKALASAAESQVLGQGRGGGRSRNSRGGKSQEVA